MLAEAGAYIVLLTGTPYRSDGKRIYGFDFQVEQTKPVTLFKTREGADHNRVVDIYEGEKSILRIVPDWETTLREAWDVENPPSLCKMTRLAYDIDLTSFDMITGEQTGTETLSTLPPSRLSGQLMRLLREDSVIEAFCEILANQLHHRREDAAEAAAIVYVGNDQEGDDRDNDHAWRVVEALARIEPSFRCLVATSTTDNNAARTLRRFQDGEGDVLVVKQMGGTGLDVPRMKVCLDLSVVRTAQQYVQRVARIATIHRRSDDPNDVQMTAVYITPNDILGAALWESFVASQGGETFLTNLEYVRTIEAGDGKVPPTPEYFRPEGLADLDYYSDTNMQVSPGETLSTVEKVIEALPVLQRLMTLPDVEKALTPLKRALGMAGGDDVSDASATRTATILDSNEERKSTQRELNDLVKRVAERRLGRRYQRGDAEYGPTVKEVHWQHKSICGIARKKPDDYTPEDIAALKESLLRELQDDD